MQTAKNVKSGQVPVGRLLDALERYIYSNLVRPNNSPFSQVLITHEGLEAVHSPEGRSPNQRDRQLVEDWIAENNLPAEVRWRRGNLVIKVATRMTTSSPQDGHAKKHKAAQSIQAFVTSVISSLLRVRLTSSSGEDLSVMIVDKDYLDSEAGEMCFITLQLAPSHNSGPVAQFDLLLDSDDKGVSFSLSNKGGQLEHRLVSSPPDLISRLLPHLRRAAASATSGSLAGDTQRDLFREFHNQVLVWQGLYDFPFGRVSEGREGLNIELKGLLSPAQRRTLEKWISDKELKVTMKMQRNKIQVVPVKRASQRKASVTPQIQQDHKIAVKSLDFLNVPFRFGGKSHTVSLSILDNKLEARPLGAKGLIYCQAEIATWDQVLFSFFVTLDYKEEGGAIDVVLALPNKAHKFSLRSFQDFDSVVLAQVQDAMENWSDYMPEDRVSPLEDARKAAAALLRKRRVESQIDKNRDGISGYFPGVVGDVLPGSPESAFLADLKKWAAEYGQTSGVALEVFSLRDQWFVRLDQRKKSRRAAFEPEVALSRWVARARKNRMFEVTGVTMTSPEDYTLEISVRGVAHIIKVLLGRHQGRTILTYKPDSESAKRFVLPGRSDREVAEHLDDVLQLSLLNWRNEEDMV